MSKRKTAIGRIKEGHLKRLRQLPEHYVVYANIVGASDERPRSLPVYSSIYEKFGTYRIGMSTYGFATLPEARKCKSEIESIADSKGFKARVTIKPCKPSI